MEAHPHRRARAHSCKRAHARTDSNLVREKQEGAVECVLVDRHTLRVTLLSHRLCAPLAWPPRSALPSPSAKMAHYGMRGGGAYHPGLPEEEEGARFPSPFTGLGEADAIASLTGMTYDENTGLQAIGDAAAGRGGASVPASLPVLCV